MIPPTQQVTQQFQSWFTFMSQLPPSPGHPLRLNVPKHDSSIVTCNRFAHLPDQSAWSSESLPRGMRPAWYRRCSGFGYAIFRSHVLVVKCKELRLLMRAHTTMDIITCTRAEWTSGQVPRQAPNQLLNVWNDDDQEKGQRVKNAGRSRGRTHFRVVHLLEI